MKLSKTLLAFGSIALLALNFGPAAHADQLDGVKKAGILKCGVLPQYKPFSYVKDPKTRQTAGYDIDICDTIASHVGVKPELVFVTAATRVTDLEQGRIDIVLANLTNTPERAKLINFSHNYLTTSVRIVVPAKSAAHSFAELASKKVSGTDGANLEAKVPKVINQAQVKVFPSPANAFLALKQGKVDAMAGDETTLIGLVGAQKAQYRILDQAVTTDQIGIGVRKNEPRMLDAVNTTLDGLEQSGQGQQIFDRWFGKDSELRMKRSFTFAPYQP